MQVEIGSRTLQDMIDGVASKALREDARRDALAGAKGQADGLADANRKLIVVGISEQNERLPADHPAKMTPSELNARINDVPTNSRFFRRMAGLRGDDAKPEKDVL